MPRRPSLDPLGGSRAWLETAWPDAVMAIAETIVAAVPDTGARVLSLKEVLVDAAGGNVDREADVLTIRRLLDEGCDLEVDILPTVTRTVPELPRPLKNWGAQWLVREILDARDRRLTGRGEADPLGGSREWLETAWPARALAMKADARGDAPPAGSLIQRVEERVEAPPPARRLSAMDWDKFVAGHRAGLIDPARRRPRGQHSSAPHRRA
jgi:hypothetical protein